MTRVLTSMIHVHSAAALDRFTFKGCVWRGAHCGDGQLVADGRGWGMSGRGSEGVGYQAVVDQVQLQQHTLYHKTCARKCDD